MTEKYVEAIERLNIGMIRKIKMVKRGQKGMNCRGALDFEVTSDHTEESYYEELKEKEKTPTRRKQSSKVILDIPEQGETLKERGFNIDMLQDKEYFKVLKMLGALPNQPLTQLTDEDLREKMEGWFESSPTIKRTEKESPPANFHKQATMKFMDRIKTAKLSDIDEF